MNDTIGWIASAAVWTILIWEVDALRRRVDTWAKATANLAHALQRMADQEAARRG